MKKSSFCLLAAAWLICCSLLFVSPSEAFDYTGAAWCCESSVTYCVNPIEPDTLCGPAAGSRSFVQVINAAAASWNAQGTAVQLVYGGTTTNLGCEPDPASGNCTGKFDGQNVVSVATSCSFPSGVLATAWWWWTGSPGQQEACCIIEADICISNDVAWYNNSSTADCAGSCYDLESVALHEFGHWMSLGHENDVGVIGYRPSMYSSFNFCEMRRAVTADDAAGMSYIYDAIGVINSSQRCDPVHSHPPYLGSAKVPMFMACSFTPCQGGGCPPGPAFCDSVTTDSCLLVCPLSDEVFEVVVKDSCGNPVCDTLGTWLSFANCPAIPCPNEEPFWPLVFPDSCDPATGTHYFTVDAGLMSCTSCEAGLFVDSQFCRPIPAKFFDNNGDLCVTNSDFVGGRICEDFNCNFASESADSAIWAAHLGHCCKGGDCPPGPAFCDSVTTDPCLLVCPLSDEVFEVVVKDSCGNPVCDTLGTWLDFSGCPAIPCPNEEPDWPKVFPDSCDPVTGTHYFTVDAGLTECSFCEADLYVDGQFCRPIQSSFLDNTGDLCVTSADFNLPVGACTDLDCDGIPGTSADSAIWAAHVGHCCPGVCPPGPAFCDSVTTDPCLLVCPLSDAVFEVIVKDSCGNPVCDTLGTWLDFTNCPAFPCPNEEPDWPRVFPDSCDPATGTHYFTVDAGADGCIVCDADLYVNGQFCRPIPARFLDNTGDLCVTNADFLPGTICSDFNCDGIPGDAADSVIWAAHFGHCCPGQCPPGPLFCDSITFDPCLLVCPESDIVYTVTAKDSCGNPICAVGDVYLDFSVCPAVFPCPSEEPNWPLVFADSCNPTTGTHYFTVDASIDVCVSCDVAIIVNGQICTRVPTYFLDNNGDQCVTGADYVGGRICDDFNCSGTDDLADSLLWLAHLNHCCGTCSDDDSDVVCNAIDNCPTIYNPGQKDSDADGVGDTCDNCPVNFNPAQEDLDSNGVGDSCCCIGIRGDLNGDGSDADILDLTFLVDFIFRGSGNPGGCPKESDVNGDGSSADILDLTFIVDRIFRGGPPPPPC